MSSSIQPDSVHSRTFKVRMHTNLMSSYIAMRIDYMRIPQSSIYDQTQSFKHLSPESPHIDGGIHEIIPTA